MCICYKEGNILLGFDRVENIVLWFLIGDCYEDLCVKYEGIKHHVIWEVYGRLFYRYWNNFIVSLVVKKEIGNIYEMLWILYEF